MAILASSGLPIEGMQLQINLVEHGTTQVGTVTIDPRWNDSTAESFTFSNSGDYAPTAASGNQAWYDFTLPMYGHRGSWYNHTHDTNYGRRDSSSTAISDIARASLWAQLGVGDSPHPGYQYSHTRLAILTNAAGAYHALQTTDSPTPNYAEPRTIGGGVNTIGSFANFRISGQYYAGGAYGGWYCLANYYGLSIDTSHFIRIINLGGNTDARSRLRVVNLVYILHGKLGATGS